MGRAMSWLRQRWRAVKGSLLRRRLRRRAEPEFSSNYGSPHVATWSRHLEHLRGRPGVRMLEIGSYEGRSALWFLENVLTHPTARLTCVDPFFSLVREVRFEHNVRLSGHGDRLTMLKAKSADVLPGMRVESFHAIYVDGDHRASAVLMDLACCWRLLEPSGVLILDDYLWNLDQPPLDRPQLAIDLFLPLVADRAEILHHEYQVIVRKR